MTHSHDYNAKRAKDPAYQERVRLYNSKAWKQLRALVLTERPLCEQCKLEGLLEAGKHVDHVVPLAKGGAALDADNLAVLCHACHSRKTMAEQHGQTSVRVKGSTADGLPRDPNHFWNK